MFNHSISVDIWLREDYHQAALWKEPVTAPFIERLKTTYLRQSNWQILLALTVICLSLYFCSHFVGRRPWTGCSTKGANYCFFDRAVSNIYLEKVLLINFITNLLKDFFLLTRYWYITLNSVFYKSSWSLLLSWSGFQQLLWENSSEQFL